MRHIKPAAHLSGYPASNLIAFQLKLNMPPSKSSKSSKLKPTDTKWSCEFDTARRESLFRNPPKDHSAYPLLKDAIAPHIESFNALFKEDGLIARGLKDIGTKYFFDGDGQAPISTRNKMSMRIKEVIVNKPQLPDSNKFSKIRSITPSECRERHVTYRGKVSGRFELRINDGDPHEIVRELGQMPIMMMVC